MGIVLPAVSEPYLAWTRKRDADFNKGMITVARTRSWPGVNTM